VGNALFRPTFSLFFTKTRKKFLKRARKREKSKKNRKKRTKNHENEKKNTDFTHFRELQLPKMGKIIQQGTKAATVSVGTQVDLFELLMLSNAPPPEIITKDGFSYKLDESKQDPKDRYWGTHYVCATAGCTRWAYVSRRNGVVMTRGPAKNPKEPHNHGPNDE